MPLDCCGSVRHLLVALLSHWKMASMQHRQLWRHYGENGTYRHEWHWTEGKAFCQFRIHPKTKPFIRFHWIFFSPFLYMFCLNYRFIRNDTSPWFDVFTASRHLLSVSSVANTNFALETFSWSVSSPVWKHVSMKTSRSFFQFCKRNLNFVSK